MLFPGRNFPLLLDPKQILVVLKSEKEKKKKKPVICSLVSSSSCLKARIPYFSTCVPVSIKTSSGCLKYED